MIFRPNTVLISLGGLSPNPPSSLRRQISFQLTFALLVLRSGPNQTNAEHKLSISFKQLLGNLKADSQNLDRLVMTELISCSLPACDRNLPVHDFILLLIFSTNGS